MSNPNESGSSSVMNQAVEAIMDLIDALSLFATISRGALGTKAGLCCEIAPTTPESVYMDKNKYIPIDLTINGKHDNLFTLTEAMNSIHENLTMRHEYPHGETWQIVDVTTGTEPQIIGRDVNNIWTMASNLIVKVYTKLT